MFKKKRIARGLDAIRRGPIPQHLAIIMDGNGRWARKRGLPRVAGHRAGMDAINRCLDGLKGIDVKYLTLYAFSTENWRRPKAEVDYLMNLPGQFIAKELDTMIANNIRLKVIGDMDGLPDHTRASVTKGIEATAGNSGLTLSFALNYGSREEILKAVRQLGQMCQRGILDPADIASEEFEKCLYTAGMPSPDLIIRTSGEIRISNFLLWQMAYSELCFIDTLWPDFNELHLYEAIADFQQRQRRFGGI
ncbi:MAG: isoprenyl transferase [Eubacteriales bacterium]|nr:isoprenyl transferase [Eubacteriales bacterium]